MAIEHSVWKIGQKPQQLRLQWRKSRAIQNG